MRSGFVGLGRMGANMVRRLVRDGHEVVAFNRTPEKTREIMTEGVEGAFSLEGLVGKLPAPLAALRNEFGGHAVKTEQQPR